MTVKNAFYAQSGGPTAVINGSACGVLQTARQHVKAIQNGSVVSPAGAHYRQLHPWFYAAACLAGIVAEQRYTASGWAELINGGSRIDVKMPAGLPLTPGVHPFPTRCVSGLTGQLHCRVAHSPITSSTLRG